MKRFVSSPGGKLEGEFRVASDKSVSHRAVLFSALAEGKTRIVSPLLSADVLSTVAAVRACGAQVEQTEGGDLIVTGGALAAPAAAIDCGNSGTLIRLFAGAAVGWGLQCELVGDSSLMARPMQRVTAPLTAMGGKALACGKGVFPPLVVGAAPAPLRGILHSNRHCSAQVKTAVLLAGLRAKGATVVAEPHVSRDHSERMLPLFGANLRQSEDGRIVEASYTPKLAAAGEVFAPADISSAMFLFVAAAICPGSDILLKEVGINPTRAGGLELLLRMGADIDIDNKRQLGAEPVADVRVRGGALHGIDIEPSMAPAAIDDLPALFIAAAAAKGETRLSGAAELRVKESDRLATMAEGLKALGARCEEKPDGIVIQGAGDEKNAFTGGEVESTGDHRIAMAFAAAATRAKGEVVIADTENVRTSFPNFVKIANAAGMRVVEEEAEAGEEA